MSLRRFRYTADSQSTSELLDLLASIHGVERVEEVADLMPQMDDPDSSSAGLSSDQSPRAHAIEIEVDREERWEAVESLAQRLATERGAALEFES
jgi:hypothetical protein